MIRSPQLCKSNVLVRGAATAILKFMGGLTAIAALALGQQPVPQRADGIIVISNLTAVGQSAPTAPNAGLSNLQLGCTTWSMSINTTGFSSVTVALQSAPNAAGNVPGSWSTFSGATILTGTNPVVGTSGAVQIYGYNPWVRVAVTSVTGSGTINGTAECWSIPSASNVSSASVTGNVNVADWGGTPTSLGQKTMSASVPVVVASDQSTIGVQGGAAVGVAPSGNPVPAGLIDSAGNIILQDYCTLHATFGFSSASGSVQMVAVSGSTTIRVCSVSFSGDTVTNLKIVTGTGSTCTSPANETGTYQQVLGFDFNWASPLITTAAKTLCLNSSASVTGGGTIIYSQR